MCKCKVWQYRFTATKQHRWRVCHYSQDGTYQFAPHQNLTLNRFMDFMRTTRAVDAYNAISKCKHQGKVKRILICLDYRTAIYKRNTYTKVEFVCCMVLCGIMKEVPNDMLSINQFRLNINIRII